MIDAMLMSTLMDTLTSFALEGMTRTKGTSREVQ